jgi:hypothetical protein
MAKPDDDKRTLKFPLARARELRRRIAFELGREAAMRCTVKVCEKSVVVSCPLPGDALAVRAMMIHREVI